MKRDYTYRYNWHKKGIISVDEHTIRFNIPADAEQHKKKSSNPEIAADKIVDVQYGYYYTGSREWMVLFIFTFACSLVLTVLDGMPYLPLLILHVPLIYISWRRRKRARLVVTAVPGRIVTVNAVIEEEEQFRQIARDIRSTAVRNYAPLSKSMTPRKEREADY